VTEFDDNSNAGNISAVINSNETNFRNNSKAGAATILTGSGDITQFLDNSSGDDATIAINSGGQSAFSDNTTAGTAKISITNGHLMFDHSSNAGTAIITNDGSIGFYDTSDARGATITNENKGFTFFGDTSSISLSGAGNATIKNQSGGSTTFNSSSNAGTAKLTNESGGETIFSGSSNARTATITTQDGGFTKFFDSSNGGQASVVTEAGGVVDISGLTTAGMTAGSIAGAGSYILGSKALTVGGNDMSTEVSGVISDGWQGGSLIKVGAGTLTLSGNSTYLGGTYISGGTLELGVPESIQNGVVFQDHGNGATLKFDAQEDFFETHWLLGFSRSDNIDLAWLPFDASVHFLWQESPNPDFGGDLRVIKGSAVQTTLFLMGFHTSDEFVVNGDGNGGTLISENRLPEGLAFDGYIAGATVFTDTNGNGKLDQGEVSTTTDAHGNFTLTGATGPLVMTGGTDTSTGLAY
jgi:autotransporter-associated beta strand protein